MPATTGFCNFLRSYVDSLLLIHQHPHANLTKGKQVISLEQPAPRRCKPASLHWLAPPAGWINLDVDGSFVGANGQAGAGNDPP